MNTAKLTHALLLSGVLACGLLDAKQVLAQNNMSEMSAMSLIGTIVVTSALAADLDNLSIKSTQISSKGLEVVVESTASGVRQTLLFSQGMGRDFSQASAASVELVATGSGKLLVASGKVLGIIPNELGRALLHHSRNREPA